MLSLTDSQQWQQLTSPFGNVAQIPAKLIKLAENQNLSLAEELIWEDIYHQNTVYQCTVASVPYLVAILNNTQDTAFQIDVSISLGVVLLYVQIEGVAKIFANSQLHKATLNDIYQSYQLAFADYRQLIESITQQNVPSDETSDVYFLIVHLMLAEQYELAEAFVTFFDDEYVFVCPTCEHEYFLQNEADELVVYVNDNYEETMDLTPSDTGNPKIEVLESLAKRLQTSNLLPLIPYFKQSIVCQKCQTKTDVLEGIMNAII